MSSTVRVHVNEKRIATGKPWKGKFLQVYPVEKSFESEAEWRSSIYQMVLSGIRFESESLHTATKVASQSKLSLNKNDWFYRKLDKTTLPPGKYYIGDLCYALNDTLYDKVFGPSFRTGIYTSTKNPNQIFMMGNTEDGLYRGTDGKDYPVDAGIIGIASMDTVDVKKFPFDGGSLYTFTSPVIVKLKEDKFIFYGEKYPDPNLTIYIQENDYADSE